MINLIKKIYELAQMAYWNSYNSCRRDFKFEECSKCINYNVCKLNYEIKNLFDDLNKKENMCGEPGNQILNEIQTESEYQESEKQSILNEAINYYNDIYNNVYNDSDYYKKNHTVVGIYEFIQLYRYFMAAIEEIKGNINIK